MKMYELQSKFLFSIAKLIFYAHESGYKVTLGRGKEDKEANSRHGGVPDSLHLDGLAQDLNFFKNGVWLKKSEDLKIFGEYWKSQGPDYYWGGDRVDKKTGKPRPDGNHFSIRFQGRA